MVEITYTRAQIPLPFRLNLNQSLIELNQEPGTILFKLYSEVKSDIITSKERII